jgi:hypothetical protein
LEGKKKKKTKNRENKTKSAHAKNTTYLQNPTEFRPTEGKKKSKRKLRPRNLHKVAELMDIMTPLLEKQKTDSKDVAAPIGR